MNGQSRKDDIPVSRKEVVDLCESLDVIQSLHTILGHNYSLDGHIDDTVYGHLSNLIGAHGAMLSRLQRRSDLETIPF
jgi:hypothetical protein